MMEVVSTPIRSAVVRVCGVLCLIAIVTGLLLSVPDIFTPTGALDVPCPGSTVSGVTSINGWTFDDVKVSSVEILVDGVVDGMAVYGSPRDVTGTYPHAPANIEYSYSLATTKYRDGTHILNTRVTDSSGNVAVFADVPVTISNSALVASPARIGFVQSREAAGTDGDGARVHSHITPKVRPRPD